MSFVAALLFAGAAASCLAEIINQSAIGPNACGACAFVNSLSSAKDAPALKALRGETGLDKARAFIADYGPKPSVVYGNHAVYTDEKGGIADLDLTVVVNQFFQANDLPAVAGEFVVRQEGETPSQFLQRIKRKLEGSIANGFHPLLGVRALAAEFDGEQARYLWNSKGGHWIAIHGVGKISVDGAGLPIEFSDSLSGQLNSGVIYAEVGRVGGVVPMTFTVDEADKEEWDWIPGDQTLSLFSPRMPLGTARANWNERAFIAVRYLIYRTEL